MLAQEFDLSKDFILGYEGHPICSNKVMSLNI